MAFYTGFTIYRIPLGFDDSMHRPLPVRQRFVAEGGLGWWCMHRSASLSLGFTRPLARPLAHLPSWAGGHAGWAASILCNSLIRLLRVWRILGGGKMRQTLCRLPAP